MINYSPLTLQPVASRQSGVFTRRVWVVERDMFIHYHGILMPIPAGRLTDFASVPRPIQWLLSDRAVYSTASVAHDDLYFNGIFSRPVADAVFLELLAHEKVPAWQRYVMYLAVRLFGGRAWQRHRHLGHPHSNQRIF